MNTTPEPNLKHRETVFSRPATSSQNRRRFPSRLRQRKFRDCIGHKSPAAIPAWSTVFSLRKEPEFVHLGLRTPKGLFRQIKQSMASDGRIASQFACRAELSPKVAFAKLRTVSITERK